jgi:hypothetical protein
MRPWASTGRSQTTEAPLHRSSRARFEHSVLLTSFQFATISNLPPTAQTTPNQRDWPHICPAAQLGGLHIGCRLIEHWKSCLLLSSLFTARPHLLPAACSRPTRRTRAAATSQAKGCRRSSTPRRRRSPATPHPPTEWNFEKAKCPCNGVKRKAGRDHDNTYTMHSKAAMAGREGCADQDHIITSAKASVIQAWQAPQHWRQRDCARFSDTMTLLQCNIVAARHCQWFLSMVLSMVHYFSASL